MSYIFPVETDGLLATLAALFAAEGNAREVAIVAHAEAEFDFVEYNSWNGGVYGFNFNLKVPVSLYVAVSEDLNESKSNIFEKVKVTTEHITDCYVCAVNITPMIHNDLEWRDKARAWLSGAGVTNQGRVRSDNIASRNCDGLLFRSQPEINLYRAFKGLGVPFAPLPVFVKGGTIYKRIEPDFIVIKDGIVVMIEVDGDTVHQETPAEAHARTTMLAHEGAHIERVRASDCATPDSAVQCAKNILAVIEKIKQRR